MREMHREGGTDTEREREMREELEATVLLPSALVLDSFDTKELLPGDSDPQTSGRLEEFISYSPWLSIGHQKKFGF